MNLNKIKKLQVTTPQGESGFLNKEARYSFNYANKEKDTEVSVAMPFRSESYASGNLFSIFAMNRPEGYLLESLRNRFGKLFSLDDMALLKITGKHQIGRLSYLDPEENIESIKPQVSLQEILQAKATDDLFDFLVDTYFDSGISGFQPKVMVPDKDGYGLVNKATAVTPNLIVKSAGEDYPHLAENEFMCMSVAKAAGFDVPEFWLSENSELFVIKRFDIDQDGHRYGLEDMCSITSKSSEDKYQSSYEAIARVISALCGEETNNSLHRYFESLCLSVMLRNGDAHLKNFALLYDHPGATIKLSPIYDIVTTRVYQSTNLRTGMNIIDRTMALNLNKSKNYPTDEALCEFGKTICQIAQPKLVLERIQVAKEEVLRDQKSRIDDDFMKEMRKSWGMPAPSIASKLK